MPDYGIIHNIIWKDNSMPSIHLKSGSPEFYEPMSNKGARACEMPGCSHIGEHKAPKNRALGEHYFFCIEHVKDYNKAWNFFSGMASHEIEDHIHKSFYGDRPTWRYDSFASAESDLNNKTWQKYHFTEDDYKNKDHGSCPFANQNRNTPEFEALAMLELTTPINLDKIKSRYKKLAKKHHPDLNNGCKKSEELLKRINIAYTVLKLACAKHEKLKEKA